MDEKQFKYPVWVDLNEMVTMLNGDKLHRFGRRRQRSEQHMGNKAPFEPDGSLFDRRNPTRVIMPTNVRIEPGAVTVTPTGNVKVGPRELILVDS